MNNQDILEFLRDTGDTYSTPEIIGIIGGCPDAVRKKLLSLERFGLVKKTVKKNHWKSNTNYWSAL